MAEIVRRMEERAAAKGSDVARNTAADAKKPSRTFEEKKAKELPKDSGNAMTSTKTPIETGETSKKSDNTRMIRRMRRNALRRCNGRRRR